MKKITLFASLMLLVAGSAFADDDQKHQTYISYDDGGTLVRPADDAREIEARVNLPIFPGDEVITNRRGRTEVVLADGNVIGLDQATAVRFVSVLDSYAGDADETIAELRYGKVAIYRIEDAREHFRLDTPSATYFASDEAIFSVETDSRGRDRVSVLDGVIEIRTPARSTRLARGEQADIDDRGMYDIASFSTNAADDFERWFLDRAERYGDADGRYLDRSLAYYEDDLSRHGSWVHTSHYGWAWRPSVAAGWRPYHNGYWMRGYSGCLTWVSYEPWGWVPYHYGRWSHDPYYGWFWVPGIGYAPAWVYWWYGNGYLGWAPSGWWDLHRPYYNWNYRPYHRAGLDLGFGFYGRVRVNDIDLRPWTFIDANTIHSNRVDRAALTTDAIRERLSRDRDGFATVSSDPARFTREEFRDPAAAINRRWTGVDTGRETAGPANIADLTPYIRRDNELPDNIRDRVIRGRSSGGDRDTGDRAAVGGGATIGGGGLAPIGGGSVAPIGGGALAPIAPSTDAGRDRINRGNGGTTRTPATINRRPVQTPAPAPRQETPSVTAPETPKRDNDSWRGRISRPSTRDRDTSESRGASEIRGAGAAPPPPPPALIDPFRRPPPRHRPHRRRPRAVRQPDPQHHIARPQLQLELRPVASEPPVIRFVRQVLLSSAAREQRQQRFIERQELEPRQRVPLRQQQRAHQTRPVSERAPNRGPLNLESRSVGGPFLCPLLHRGGTVLYSRSLDSALDDESVAPPEPDDRALGG